MKPKNTQIAAITCATFLVLTAMSHAAVIASNTTSNVTNVSTYTSPGQPGTTNTVSADGSNTAWGQNITMAQSFTTGTLGSVNVLSTITVATVGATSASTVTATLYQASASQPNGEFIKVGTVLASTATSVTTGAGPATITFDFSTANLTLSNNTLYCFNLASGTGQNAFTWAGSSANPYAGGEALVLFPDDLSSKGFLTDNVPSSDVIVGDRVFTVTAIPEPSAALLGGLGMLVLLRRRRA